MTSFRCNIFVVIFAIVCLFCICPNRVLTFDKLDTTNAIIQFDPYVSILDRYNHSRYNVDYLITLVTKVSSRFTKFYIELHPQDLYEQTSLRLSLTAIARYNCLPDTSTKIDVLLVISRIDCNCLNLTSLRSAAVIITDETNLLCNDTVRTIVLHQDLFKECNSFKKCKRKQVDAVYVEQNLFLKYKWGIFSTFQKFCNETQIFSGDFTPDVVVVKYLDIENLLRNDFVNCKTFNANSLQSHQIIKRFSISDTNDEHIINMTNFVSTWIKLLAKTNVKYIISKAFDTPYFHQTNGWWYLDNDCDNPNEYMFKEKLDVHHKIDFEEDPRNFEWLRKEKLFDKNTTGIVFTGTIDSKILWNDFCRLLDVHGWYSTSSLINSIPISQLQTKCDNNWQIIFVTNDFTKRTVQKIPLTLSQNVVFLAHVKLRYSKLKIAQQFKNSLDTNGYKFGYFLSIEVCINHWHVGNVESTYSNIFKDPDSKIYIFQFEETVSSVHLGATRLFRQRLVIFNQCRKLIMNYRNDSTEVGFSIQRYFPGDKFYKSSHILQNFVKYVDLLSNWAEKQTNVVVFIGIDSDAIRKKQRRKEHSSLGWYSYDEENRLYITKREEAFKISVSHYADSAVGLSTSQVLMIVAGLLALIISTITLAANITRRYYENKILSKVEIYEFLNGNGALNAADACKVPYNKDKYEISEDNFNLDKHNLLGFGEFGQVCRGTIFVEEIEIPTAVKALNPLTFHKTTLHGMLSEIKVLAYLGNHQNIIELLGANTACLNKGKVYIFLELCELGSLEKRLREIRKSLNQVHDGPIYINTECAVNYSLSCHNSLNTNILKDFYKWSTETCNGMAYLAEKHVVHADLATRNILLNLQEKVKICDFGLSRRMYNYTNYVKTGQEPLPWKWMAPESLRCNEFSEKSDVWAYGITIWEIYSLGCSPYPGLSWEVNFSEKLKSGLRLHEPEFNHNNMYELMKLCWNTLPNDRPNFSQIYAFLSNCENNKRNVYTEVLSS